jgi:hypothetical protein
MRAEPVNASPIGDSSECKYVPLADVGAEFLFQVVSKRVERAALIVTAIKTDSSSPSTRSEWSKSGLRLISVKTALCVIRYEMSIRTFLEDYVSPLPRLIVG